MICDISSMIGISPLIPFLIGLHLATVGLIAMLFAWLQKP